MVGRFGVYPLRSVLPRADDAFLRVVSLRAISVGVPTTSRLPMGMLSCMHQTGKRGLPPVPPSSMHPLDICGTTPASVHPLIPVPSQHTPIVPRHSFCKQCVCSATGATPQGGTRVPCPTCQEHNTHHPLSANADLQALIDVAKEPGRQGTQPPPSVCLGGTPNGRGPAKSPTPIRPHGGGGGRREVGAPPPSVLPQSPMVLIHCRYPPGAAYTRPSDAHPLSDTLCRRDLSLCGFSVQVFFGLYTNTKHTH